jgi:phosphate-selective porin OprO and OprP
MNATKFALFSTVAAVALSASNPVLAQASDAEVEALRAEVAALKAQLATISAKVDAVAAAPASASAPTPTPTSTPKPTATPAPEKKGGPEISFKGAPEIKTADGWSFKPRGRMHYDVGTISTPGAYAVNRNLGFASRVRRVRLGMEGTVPGNFGYKVEADFANANVAFGDVWLTYNPANAPIVVRAGNFELNNMEQTSSSNFVTFTERSAFNEAFINARRLGVAATVFNKDDSLRGEIGLFTGHSIDSSIDNNGWIGAARLVYAPKTLGGQLHFGLNYQYRDFASNNAGVANPSVGSASTNQLARYRARPNTQLTDVRFVDTGSFAASSDQIVGAEFAGIWKGLYVAGEAQWLKAKGYDAGDIATGLNSFSGGNVAVVPASNPGYFGGHAEIGYFLTGETRGYGKGLWARTKVLNPVGKGGLGAFQVAARLDYLDLNDDALKTGLTNNFANGTTSLAAANARLGRGGTQTGYLFAVNWHPVDYVRFMLNYGNINVKGGPLAATVLPLSTDPVDERSYSVDLFTLRAQIDF